MSDGQNVQCFTLSATQFKAAERAIGARQRIETPEILYSLLLVIEDYRAGSLIDDRG